jgi:chromosome segregation ATPase
LAVGVLAGAFISLANAQRQARAETDNLIRSLDAAIKARGADVASSRAQADVERMRTQARLDEIAAEQARLKGPRGKGSGNRALELEAQELTWKVIELEATVRLADRTIRDMEKTTSNVAVPTAKAASAVTALGNSIGVAGGQARAANDDFARLYDRLNPFEASMRQLAADEALIRSQKNLTEARKEELLASLEQERFRNRTANLGPAKVSDKLLSEGPLAEVGKVRQEFEDEMERLREGARRDTVVVADSFAQMAQRITSSLQGLANSIRSGDFLGILGGALDIFMQLGSAGVFGGGLQTRLNSVPGRANGAPGKT